MTARPIPESPSRIASGERRAAAGARGRPARRAADGFGARRSPDVSGPVLFARYAYGPNRLGYCGPDDVEALFGEATALPRTPPARATAARGGEATALGGDAALRSLARGFEGAYPYLELIARSNGIADPLDRRVVEAYWLGNGLQDAVRADALGDSLATRFRPRLRPETWRWLAAAAPAGARPVHAFHVLDVFPKVGLLREGAVDDALRVMDACRIRWGRVEERVGDWLVASVRRLELVDGRLGLGQPVAERVQGWRDGLGFLPDLAPGDIVSIHWDWACDRLDGRQLANLVRWTERELRLANRTI